MNRPLLNIYKVNYHYPGSGWVLNCFDFEVYKGNCLGIIGTNGSGKSTLLKLIAGILTPDSGCVFVGGMPVGNYCRKKLATKIGYLPQKVNPLFNYKVNDIVLMGRYCHSSWLGTSSKKDQEIADKCMDDVDVLPYKYKYINELSGGERQRVWLASVLAQRPEVMLLDEPGNCLDLHHQVSFMNLIKTISSKGIAVIIITHELNLASQFCDKLLFMDNGNSVVLDEVEAVFEHISSKSDYSEGLSFLQHPINYKPSLLPCNKYLD